MAQGLPHPHFNSSRLVRVLSDLAVKDAPGSKQSFGERLGQWLDFNDALSLFAALNGAAAQVPEPAPGKPSTGSEAARKALARVRAALVDLIGGAGVPAPEEGKADFEPYHRYCLARQRDMGANIGPLRASVRAALGRRSAALGRLAAVDAVMEQALAARERELLAKVPALLATRFDALREAHLAGTQPDGWLAAFCREMQTVLLAELDLRLQPVEALIAALDQELTGGNA